jgi:amino acid transporter
MNTTVKPKRLLKAFSLAAVIFLTVSGGPYGLESLVQSAGKNGALLLLLLVPLLWDIPTILTVLELNSMMPVEGGYYKWVNRALGRRWAFYECWWSWLYSFTDLAIYPVLFVTYISFFCPQLIHYKIPIYLIIIWGCAGLNMLGIVPVGRTSLILGSVVIIPFVFLLGAAVTNPTFHFTFPVLTLKGIGFSALGSSLYTVMWNFLGWDNTTTYAGEVDRPVRSYIISTGIAFILVLLLYLATTFVAQNSGVDFDKLGDVDHGGGYPILGLQIGGNWLATIIAIGGMASAVGIFSAVILSISRVPKAMADDKFLPPIFGKLHSRFNTPYISIIVSATLVSLMVFWDFKELLIIDIMLYGAGLFLEFISLIVLRIKEPDAPRPFRIPLGTAMLCLVLLSPIAVYTVALIAQLTDANSGHSPVYFAIGALLTAEIFWQLLKLRKSSQD